MLLSRFSREATEHKAKRLGRGQEYVQDVMRLASDVQGDGVWMTPEAVAKIQAKWEPTHPTTPMIQVGSKGKPGTELLAIIPRWLARLLAGPECGCDDYARQMNQWGVEGCERRFNEIVTHLSGQAKNLPLSRTVARKWVRLAIDRAKTKEQKELTNG